MVFCFQLFNIKVVNAHTFLGAENLEVDGDGCAIYNNGHINAINVAAERLIICEESETGDFTEFNLCILGEIEEFRIFGQLVVPLSKPIVGVLALYYAVGYWNSYFSAMIYLSKKELQPLALYIKSVVIQGSLESITGMPTGGVVNIKDMLSALQLKYAVIVVSVLPMLLIYPLISGNLEKGLMVGAVKS